MLLGADTAEAGNALMWTDLNGRKLNGTKIRGWNGGIALARDIGPQGNPNDVAYTVFVDNPSRDFGKKDPGALEIYIITKTGLTPLAKVKGGVQVHDAYRELAGLAAYNGLLLLADSVGNEIFAFDVRTASHGPFATVPVANLGGIAFEPDGKLLVATTAASSASRSTTTGRRSTFPVLPPWSPRPTCRRRSKSSRMTARFT